MSWLNRLVCSLRTRKLNRDLGDEFAFHLEMKTHDLVSAGLSPEEARHQALRQFGNVIATKERTRDMDILPSLDSLGRDARFSIRTLRKSPAFTAVAVITLALGIGANVAVFSLVYGLLLRPLPFPDSENLLLLSAVDSQGREDFISYVDLQDWRRQSTTIERFSAYVNQSVNLTGEREPERLNGAFVSAGFFELLGVRAALGRTFQQGEDDPGSPPVVVASHELWRDKFGGADDFVGRQLILNGNPFTVAGVLPAGFRFPWSLTEIWIPYPYYPNYRPGQRGDINAAGFAHVRPGFSREQAQAEMTTIARRLAAQFPDTNRDRGVRAQPFHEFLVRDSRPSVLLLWGAVLFVFLIACANLANLALSRILSREREIGVRMALGASRAQVLHQLLVENVLIAIAGLGLGLLLGYWGTQFLAASQAGTLPVGTRVELNAGGAAFGLCLALFGGLLCGSLAAVHVLRRDRSASLHAGGRGLSEGRKLGMTRRLLVWWPRSLCAWSCLPARASC
jgi:predicted permease